MDFIQIGFFEYLIMDIEYVSYSEFAEFDDAIWHIKIVNLNDKTIKNVTLDQLIKIETEFKTTPDYLGWTKNCKLFFWKAKKILSGTWDFNYNEHNNESEEDVNHNSLVAR